MGARKKAGIAIIATAAAIAAYFVTGQSSNEIAAIHGAGLENASKCISGDFKADPSKDKVEITMDAYQWKFSYCTITVYEGQTVVLTLKSLDVPHGLTIDGYPELGVKHATPDADTVIRFTAYKVGQFTYYCTIFCGEGHPLHKGQLVVLAA